MKKTMLRVLGAVVLALVVVGAVHLKSERMPDLAVYLAACRAWLAGVDPYAVAPDGLPYVYPPGTWLLWLPLAWLPEPVVVALWGAVLACSLGALVYIWARWWWTPVWIGVPLALFIGGGAGLMAVQQGNVALILYLAVWGGLTLWLRGHSAWSVVCIGAAAVFKPLLWAFAVPVLLTWPRPSTVRPRQLLVGLLVVAGLVAYGMALAHPGYRTNVAARVGAERGWMSPCSLAWWREVTGLAWLWLPWAAIVGGWTLRHLRSGPWPRQTVACVCVLAYLSGAPWVKGYDYVLAVPCVWWLACDYAAGRWLLVGVALGGYALVTPLAPLPGLRDLLWQYYPWLLAVALWAWATWPGRGPLPSQADRPAHLSP